MFKLSIKEKLAQWSSYRLQVISIETPVVLVMRKTKKGQQIARLAYVTIKLDH